MRVIAARICGLLCIVGLALALQADAAPIDDAMLALVSGDSAKGISMLRALAENGDIQAAIFLGDTYHDGTGDIPKDYVESTKWYRSVANHGVPMGQYDLGRAYFGGEGVARNGAEALKLYHLAADRGYAPAQVQVAHAYTDPRLFDLKGIAENPAEGAKWLRRAAEQGDGDGQGVLGQFYEDGKGVQQDYVQAYMWETLAIASMESKKGKYFADEVRAARDELTGKMSKSQIAEGERLAENWQPGNIRTQVTIKDTGRTVAACFINNARMYGAQTCQPPANLVGAVFGSCAREEAAYKADLDAQHPNDPVFVDEVMTKIHERMSNSVQAALLDSQIKSGRCR